MAMRMQGALWGIALALAVVRQAAADVPIMADFDFTMAQGKWHAVAVVLSEGKLETSVGHETAMAPEESGDLIISKTIPEQGKCTYEDLRLMHTDQPAKFTTKEGSVVCVVDTDYDNYCINHVQTRGPVSALHLYTRQPELSGELKGKFQTQAKSLGFSEDKIVYLTKPAPCL